MKSKIKDYYDFAGYWDSDIVYFRKSENIKLCLDGQTFGSLQNQFIYRSSLNIDANRSSLNIDASILLICGRFYHHYKFRDNYYFSNDDIINAVKSSGKLFYKRFLHPVEIFSYDKLVELHKTAKSPILFFHRFDDTMGYSRKNPNNVILSCQKDANLVEIGFTTIPADKLNREIEWFLSNTLREEMQMPEFSDNEKIQQHGFDVKKSFRKVK